MSKYLLKGGTVVTFVQGGGDKPHVYKADVLVEGNTITRIEDDIQPGAGVEVIDAQNNHGDVSLGEFLVKNSWHVQASLTPGEVEIGTLAGYLEALHSGVTTVLDHFNVAHTPAHADAALRATLACGARAIWAPARQSPPTRVFPSPEFAQEAESEKWQRAKLKEWGADGGKLRPDGRVTLGLSYDNSWVGSMETHKEWIAYARANSVAIITAHVGYGPVIRSWHDAGLLGPDVVFSHCNGLADADDPDHEDWAALKASGAAIGATPVGELGMSYGTTVALDALKRGVKVGLGADSNSVNGGDMFGPMRFALQWARAREHVHTHTHDQQAPLHLPFAAADAFRLATVGGADALGLAHAVGTVEVGKRADLLLFDADSVALAGAGDPVRAIVGHASAADVDTVFVDGEILKRGGRLVCDWAPVGEELKERAREIRERWPEDRLEQLWKQWYETNGPLTF